MIKHSAFMSLCNFVQSNNYKQLNDMALLNSKGQFSVILYRKV